MNPAAALLMTAAGAVVLVATSRRQAGPFEAAEGGLSLGGVDLAGEAEALFYQATERAPNVSQSTAARNVAAFLTMLQRSEGTDRAPDPYRVTYAYRHTIVDLSDHPTLTGEWAGVVLSDSMCANAGLGPGCRSTAAGAYQIIKPTWRRLRARLNLPDFSAASQDAAAIQLLRERGALPAVEAGDVPRACYIARAEWASLPGNAAKQGQRPISQLVAWYEQSGGSLA